MIDKIVGYIYKADIFCSACLGDVEPFLDDTAKYHGIDRMDESSFDSGDFPKVICSTDVTDETCGWCGNFLDESYDPAPCCPDPGCFGNPCEFPGYAPNH